MFFNFEAEGVFRRSECLSGYSQKRLLIFLFNNMQKTKLSLLKIIGMIIVGFALSAFVTFYIFTFKDLKINIAVFVGVFLFYLYALKQGSVFNDALEKDFAKNRDKSGLNRWNDNIKDLFKRL